MQILRSKVYFFENKQILNYISKQLRITHAVINTILSTCKQVIITTLSTCKQVIMSTGGG